MRRLRDSLVVLSVLAWCGAGVVVGATRAAVERILS